VEPEHVTADIIRLLATEPQFCPHLHIPLQSGDDRILHLMGRGYTAAEYRTIVGRLRDEVRDVAVSTDVMVGFPGETEEAFEATLSLVREIGFSGLHLFKYSPRPGTRAAGFPGQVPGGEKERRLKLLLAVGRELRAAFAARFVGRTVQVLVETRNPNGLWEGLSGHYLPVAFPADENYTGAAVFVKVEGFKNDTLCGRLLKKDLH
jgi:threonylcarbamoyladenosine tRNA methylthiotransferase MtaB